jgi:nicotinamide-nucleotide amidase
MQAEIITIGDEILIGQVVDTNSTFISKNLNKIGVSVYQITSIQDEKDHILKALTEAEENADIIILTGGLGPTKDDITKSTLAEYFEDTLIRDDAVLRNIEKLWEKYIKQELSQVNIDQSLVPSKATALMNLYGSAPGMWIEKENKVFVSLPGVPFEMKILMEKEVIPRLRKQFELPYILHKTILTYGLGESKLAERIESWEDNLPEFIKLAYLPNLGKVRLRISAKGNNKGLIEQEVEKQIKNLLPQIEDVFMGFEEESTLESQIASILTKKRKTLAIAESCTGGKIAEQLTTMPGASAFFNGSVVTYATQSKIDILDVHAEIIKEHSVVSEEVAKAMALGVKGLYRSDFAIATTGNAGPTKGESNVDIGTVCIAIATPDNVYAKTFLLGNHRIKVINRAVNKSFELLYKEISKI